MATSISITIIYGTGNSITRSFDVPVTIRQVLDQANVKGGLGYGANVEGYIDGVPQPDSITLRDGDVLEVHDKACSKAAGFSVTVTYGTGNEIVREFPVGATLGDVLGNANVKGGLGFGANVEGHIDGVPQPNSLTLRSGDVIAVHDKACSKAAKKAAAKPAPMPAPKAKAAAVKRKK